MTAIVDMHCHVLPGVDDGPATMAETLAALKQAQAQGVGAMIVTPHFHPGRYAVTAGQARETLSRVRARAAREGLKIRLYPGQECYWYSDLVHQLDSGNAMTMCGTDYVLVEYETEVPYTTILQSMRVLTENGYRPIIAHFERYRCLYQKRERLEELRGKGALLQLNFDRLLDRDGFFRPNIWRRLLKDGYVDFLGSDTHGMKFRPLHVKQAMEWMQADVNAAVRNRILEENMQLLLPRSGQ